MTIMGDNYTPTMIAKKLNVSTTTLRRYEDQGLVPEVPRTPSNRRCYTDIHVQAFLLRFGHFYKDMRFQLCTM